MKDRWSELAGDIDKGTAELLDGALRRYAAPPAPASAREAAVEAALRAMDARPRGRLQSMLEQVRVEARFLPYWYYLASLFLSVAGVCLLLMAPAGADRIGILAGMAPLPALLGLLELFHGADEGMAEIERACRFSWARVLSARMLVIGALSCAASAALGLSTRLDSAWMAAGLVVIPYCLSAATGLALAVLLQGRAGSAQVALAVAFANGAVALAVQMEAGRLAAVAPPCWLATMALSAGMLLLAVRYTLKSTGIFMERKLQPWN